jgi:hypothetical protein
MTCGPPTPCSSRGASLPAQGSGFDRASEKFRALLAKDTTSLLKYLMPDGIDHLHVQTRYFGHLKGKK